MNGSELTLTVTRAKGDYFWAIAFNALRSPSIPIFFAVALLFVLVPNVLENGGIRVDQLSVIAAIYAALISLYYVALVGAVWFTARRNWSAPGALEPLSYRFTSEGIGASFSMGQGQMAWPLWSGAFETNALLVIRQNLGLLHIIPKRDLDGAALLRLRAVLRERLGDKARLGKESDA